MKFRTLALALALSCGFTALAEAKTKVHKVATRVRKPKKYKNHKVKAHKVKRAKAKTHHTI